MGHQQQAERTYRPFDAKPVECMLRPIRNHGGSDDDVYDPFVGSGTTIIAAEQLRRRCLAMEISPEYVDVTCERFRQFTEEQPVLEAGALLFDEVKAQRHG